MTDRSGVAVELYFSLTFPEWYVELLASSEESRLTISGIPRSTDVLASASLWTSKSE